MRRAFLPLALAVLLSSCHYVKPRVAIDLTNKSHVPIKNIEIDYPGGSYGVPALDVYALNHHTAEIDQHPCVLKIRFDDNGGHSQPEQQIKLGDSCPPKVSLVVNAQLAVSAEPAK